jgi:hypothetical protein
VVASVHAGLSPHHPVCPSLQQASERSILDPDAGRRVPLTNHSTVPFPPLGLIGCLCPAPAVVWHWSALVLGLIQRAICAYILTHGPCVLVWLPWFCLVARIRS